MKRKEDARNSKDEGICPSPPTHIPSLGQLNIAQKYMCGVCRLPFARLLAFHIPPFFRNKLKCITTHIPPCL